MQEIDAYGFPDDLMEHPMLAWMGQDYVGYVAVELLKRFQEQSLATEMLAIKCEERPRLLTKVDDSTGVVLSVEAAFDLQILLRTLAGSCWRLRGDAKFTAISSDQPTKISKEITFDIRSNEEVT